MRDIALISEHASPLAPPGGSDSGGQNVYVAQVAGNLAALGYKVDVFTRRDSGEAPEVVDTEQGVRVVNLRAGPEEPVRKEDMFVLMDEFQFSMQKFMKRERRSYDLIHANFWMSGYVAAELKRTKEIPFVITFHALGKIRRMYQGEADGFPDERFEVEERLVREADLIIAECPQDEEDLITLYGADPHRIRTVPCGFDPQEFGPVERAFARTRLGLPLHENVILQLGRIAARKGIDTVIKALAVLREEHGIPATLLIVGGESDTPDPEATPEIGRLTQVAAEEGVSDRVVFTGRRPREELKYYYSAADVFVTTPWYEPFGITPLESMACGTPVVGSAVGGLKYTIADGESGYLVPPRDPAALGGRLAHMLGHPGLLQKMRRQALARARRMMTWQEVSGCLASVYEEALGRGRDPRALDMLSVISDVFDEAGDTMRRSGRLLASPLAQVVDALCGSFLAGGKVLVCGNGGSASDAQHFVCEMMGRFRQAGRPALPAIGLAADTALITAWSNDAGYEDVFARQVDGLGAPGDVLLAISTSGNSENIIRACESARRGGLTSVGLAGCDGGLLRAAADLTLIVPSWDVQRIQETQSVLLHIVAELVERRVAAEMPAGRRDLVDAGGGMFESGLRAIETGEWKGMLETWRTL